MSFDPVLWAMKDAPVANVEEWAILACLAEHADDDGCNAMPSQATIAKRTKTSPATVKRRIADLEQRRVIQRGDQTLAERYPADRRPVVWDLMIPYGWFPSIERIQESRADKGRPPLRPGDRPKLSPAPDKPRRVDHGKPKPDRSTSATALQEPPLSGSGGATSSERGVSEFGTGGLPDPQPSPRTLLGNPPPESDATESESAALFEDSPQSAAAAPSRRKPASSKAKKDHPAYDERVTRMVNRYIQWRRAERKVPALLRESELFHALVKTYVHPAFTAGFTDQQVEDALAACARGGHEWPAEAIWRRALHGEPLSGQPAKPVRHQSQGHHDGIALAMRERAREEAEEAAARSHNPQITATIHSINDPNRGAA